MLKRDLVWISTAIRQVNRNGKDFVNKVEEATREEKKHSLETTQN